MTGNAISEQAVSADLEAPREKAGPVRRFLVPALVVLGLSVVAAGSLLSDRDRGRGEEAYLEPVQRGEIAQVIKAAGQIDPRVKVNISAHVIGKIERLFVEEGDEIEAGRPFLQLEQEAFIAARDRAAAQVEITRSRLRQAEINLEDAQLKERRAERLTGENVISREALEQAQLQTKSAELSLEQAREAIRDAEAALVYALDDLRKTTIYAPLTGRVIGLNAEEGEVVVSGTMNNPASVIGTIADLSEILVEVDVDENEIVDAQVGQPARVTVDAVADHVYLGHVVEIGSSGFSKPQQPDVTFFKVKVLLDQPDERLRAGMSARAEIEVDRHRDALVVPIQSVVYRPPAGAEEVSAEDEIKVVFVHREGVVVQTPVEVGLSDDTSIEVLSGLAEGDQVVVGPYRVLKSLQDGDAIRPKDGEQREASTGEDAEDG
jgi:HlyD family secretion protein